jgi:phosphotransferase system HPr (HPr) family protein
MRRATEEDAIVARREVTIVNELGLHARPAAEFARRARAFRAEVWIVRDGVRFSAGSLIDILRANLDHGATATLEAKGRDAEAAVDRLAQVLKELKD